MSTDDNNSERPLEWGTIFTRGGEHTLGGVENVRSTAWTEADEAAYLARIKEKAIHMAASLIHEARAEADAIRQAAREEGYNTGLEDAKAELDAFRSGMADSVSAVLSAIEGQCAHIFTQWREDLMAVARLAVEKISSLQLSEERAATLESLIAESVALLESRRELVIRVHPEDEPVTDDIIRLTREKFPDVQSWRVKPDAGVSPGGMVVESESSLAEGRVESRQAAVMEVLEHLTLPGVP